MNIYWRPLKPGILKIFWCFADLNLKQGWHWHITNMISLEYCKMFCKCGKHLCKLQLKISYHLCKKVILKVIHRNKNLWIWLLPCWCRWRRWRPSRQPRPQWCRCWQWGRCGSRAPTQGYCAVRAHTDQMRF